MGGIEQNLFALTSGLSERGHTQTLLHSSDYPAQPDYLSPFSDHHALSNQADLTRLVSEQSPDILILHQPFSDIAPPYELPCPVVRVVHDHNLTCPRRHKYFPLSKQICHEAAGSACVRHGCLVGRSSSGKLQLLDISARLQDIRAHHDLDRLIVASNFMRDELIKNGLPAERIEILPPLPGDLDRKATPVDGNARTIYYLGQLIRGKGVDSLLKAMTQVTPPWQLWIIGDGNMRQELEELTEELGFREWIHFLGHLSHSECTARLEGASIVAVPSRWPEPFGMVGVEAMAAGRPVVAFNVGGIRDWLWHGVNGLGAAEGDWRTLGRHLDWLLNDNKLLADLGNNSRKMFDNYYKFCVYLDKFENLISRVVEGGIRRRKGTSDRL